MTEEFRDVRGKKRASGLRIIIVAYRPKLGKVDDLIELTQERLPILRAEGLVIERPPTVGQAADGPVVEVFERAPAGSRLRNTGWGSLGTICGCFAASSH